MSGILEVAQSFDNSDVKFSAYLKCQRCCDSRLSNSTLETTRIEPASYLFLMILLRQLLVVRIYLFHLMYIVAFINFGS